MSGGRVLDIREYILGLDEESKLSISDLDPLDGAEIPIKKECWEWSKRVVDTDTLIVTHMTVSVNKDSSGLKITNLLIYCDFILNGRVKFNAWTGLEALKTYIKNGIEPEQDV